ncbi:OmpA family protein [Lutimaribacter marinistellae]|uniref:OmpA family protein n=1 Tax=Lutimaribacter marinistellae TaxID=1820329 RepID=A0ABV7TMC1_9RHOB
MRNWFQSLVFGIVFSCLASIGLAQTFGTVNFEFDSDQLDESGRAQVLEIAEALKAIDTYKPTVVVGYTDAVGSSAYNDNLGLRRARTVAQALIAAGVPVDRVDTIQSRGERELLVAVRTPERLNRRVTVGLGQILAACRSYRDVPLSQDDIGDTLQADLVAQVVDARSVYQQLTQTGGNPSAFQMAGAARSDCEQAAGYSGDSIRKLEYAKRCMCSTARMDVALGRVPPPS